MPSCPTLLFSGFMRQASVKFGVPPRLQDVLGEFYIITQQYVVGWSSELNRVVEIPTTTVLESGRVTPNSTHGTGS